MSNLAITLILLTPVFLPALVGLVMLVQKARR